VIEPSPELKPVFASTKIKEHPEDYTIVSINRKEEKKTREILKNIEPWSSVTFDLEEISVVLKEDEWKRIKNHFQVYQEESPYRLLTFDIVLDLDLVGYLSVISGLLTKEGISIYAVSTYLRDHILVKKKDAEKAISVIRKLIESSH
jgi:hypothetical protein